jgi:hypothetical protein
MTITVMGVVRGQGAGGRELVLCASLLVYLCWTGGQHTEIRTASTRVSSACCAASVRKVDVSGIITTVKTESACPTETPPTHGTSTQEQDQQQLEPT